MTTLEVNQIARDVLYLDFEYTQRMDTDLHTVVFGAAHVPVDRSAIADVHGNLSKDVTRAAGADAFMVFKPSRTYVNVVHVPEVNERTGQGWMPSRRPLGM